jgi:hypothetical protein
MDGSRIDDLFMDLGLRSEMLNITDPIWLFRGQQEDLDVITVFNFLITQGIDPLHVLSKMKDAEGEGLDIIKILDYWNSITDNLNWYKIFEYISYDSGMFSDYLAESGEFEGLNHADALLLFDYMKSRNVDIVELSYQLEKNNYVHQASEHISLLDMFTSNMVFTEGANDYDAFGRSLWDAYPQQSSRVNQKMLDVAMDFAKFVETQKNQSG